MLNRVFGYWLINKGDIKMNINCKRYFETINGTEKTFLKKWHKKTFEKFYNNHKEEFELHHKTWLENYDKLSYDEFTKEEKKTDPTENHKIEYFFTQIPVKIERWLIMGFLYVKDKTVLGGKTWNDNYHLLSKLCRYEDWTDVKITWWDKIRFKLVTGYNFE
jgi:hypothetical protein